MFTLRADVCQPFLSAKKPHTACKPPIRSAPHGFWLSGCFPDSGLIKDEGRYDNGGNSIRSVPQSSVNLSILESDDGT